jgi:hypothetical protein
MLCDQFPQLSQSSLCDLRGSKERIATGREISPSALKQDDLHIRFMITGTEVEKISGHQTHTIGNPGKEQR